MADLDHPEETDEPEVLRLWGDRAEEIRPTIAAAIRAALQKYETDDGVVAPASTWVLSAPAPE